MESLDFTNPMAVEAELRKTIEFLKGSGFSMALSAEFQFSPDYDQVWNSEWAKYDKLEKARKDCGIERLEWQNELDEYRDSAQTERRETSSDDSIDSRSKNSLISYLFAFSMEQYGEAPTINRLQGWKTAISSWRLFREKYNSDDKGFRLYLSDAQRASYFLLDDWWHSRYCSTGDMASFKNSLDELFSITSTSPPTSTSFPYTWKYNSLYHKLCLELFMREFHPMEWEPFNPHSFLAGLMSSRKKATKEAISMRFAYFALQEKLEPSHSGSFPVYPRYARDKQLWRENEYFNEPAKDGIAREIWKLVDQNSPDPRYLWDVKAKKTIRVDQHHPEYVCISHTWGRWTVKPPSHVSIPGVPWKILENTLYNVQDLPNMLLKLNHDFIWLDLFCLPQDDSPEHRAEVANQTAIFHRAKKCIAWLNDVETWDGTKAAIDYLGMKYLRTSATDPELTVSDKRLKSSIATAADKHLELMKASDEPSTWFSSLWTLQEAALCPDLQLCTRSMELLLDNTGTPISLSTLMAILSLLRAPNRSQMAEFPSDPPFDIVPECVSKLFLLGKITKLEWLLEHLTPMDIMVTSNTRTCKRSRAVAIMNALGVLDWYKTDPEGGKLGTGGKEENLVLDTFPIEFVREAARKYGAVFYTAVKSVNSYRVKTHEGLWGFPDVHIGSMMPFSETHGWYTSVMNAVTVPTIQKKDHEAVASWHINEDGSVRIRSAGIVSCSSNSANKPPIKSFVATMEGRERLTIVQNNTAHNDLHASLRELAGDTMVFYAIVLQEDYGKKSGILLQAPRTRIPKPGKRWLIKAGFFNTLESSSPTPCTAVNWCVA
ncbi:hypothetical protein TGAMA5MH_04951 [Trichoderma gamsii]|uniref:Heterokaryon incompatibility domain-containing protein n=1 Tax=Trichoderma gamsii TaxID=398673 RepID=A0A2K0TBW0_9HYPO|nr:hypothetical protein TGAMA5MH_04951 [Trichoderma gamsii]